MHHIFFVPGIMGSRLSLDGEEVWPPTVGEVVGGYSRIDKLIDPAVKSTGVIEKQCVAVYGPLLDALRDAGAKETGATHRLTPWHYDWRQDLRGLSDALAAAFAAIVSADASARISIVCHSMGGLVTRGALEATEHAAAAWRAKVRTVLFLATPHEGAPLAFSRILGIGGASTGLSAAQLRTLANDGRYPSGYQLLPDENEPVTWRLDGIDPFAGQTIAQLAAAGAHGLNASSLAAARAFRARLDPSRRHRSTRYFSVVSASHKTVTRFDGEGTVLTQVQPKNSGDGTVPLRSGAALPVQTGFVVADHVGVAKEDESHALMLMLFGLKSVEPVSLGAEAPATPKLSVSPMTAANGEPWEIVVAFPAGAGGFDGEVTITPDGPAGAAPYRIPLSVSAEGVTALSIDGPPLSPGLYKVVLHAGGAEIQEQPLIVSSPVGA